MIYVDSSVVLSFLLAEDRRPDAAILDGCVSSRLLEYEVWIVIHRRKLTRSHSEPTAAILGTVQFMEMVPFVLDRAREPFPRPVRTLDALHLASALYLRERMRKGGRCGPPFRR